MDEYWLLKEAEDAVEELFSDTSVSPETTLEHLEALHQDIKERIKLLKNDIKSRDRG